MIDDEQAFIVEVIDDVFTEVIADEVVIMFKPFFK
jgi:hypothetical protein